jgi:hypothetical protein
MAYFDGLQPYLETWQKTTDQDLNILECKVKEDLQDPLKELIAQITL